MMKTPEVHAVEVILVSVSCARLSNEEYMVTSGQTNHLDFWIRVAILNVSAPPKIALPVAKTALHEPR